MRWITRKNAKVDRIACPWLIEKFVDPQAEFLFVAADEVLVTAEREGAVPFDVEGAELGHRDGICSFEAIIEKYGIDDPALAMLAQIVHGADVARDIAVTPQAAGLKAVAHGFSLVYGEDDHGKLRAETPVYDALYRWCQAEVEKI